MKIGIVLSSSPAYSETFFNTKIEELKENRNEVILFCRRIQDDFQLCPVKLAPKVSGNPFIMSALFIKETVQLVPYIKRVFKFIRLEKKEGTSGRQITKMIYLNAHLLKSNLDWLHFGFTALALGSETVAKTIGAKMAVSCRGFDIAVFPLKHPGCYKRLWKYVDKVHTISDDLLWLAKSQGLPETVGVEKITPAIDPKFFNKQSRKFTCNEKIILMTVGRLHWKKGYIQILEALAILNRNGIDFIYKIIGEGKEYERITFAAYELGLKNRVMFIGKLPHNQVRTTLEEAHLYIQYSIQEGFCNSVLEAQALGKLCVVSNAEGLPENVLHGKTGWVVPKYSPELLAQQIITIINMSPVEKSEIIERATKRVREEFNIKKQGMEFINFYKSDVN